MVGGELVRAEGRAQGVHALVQDRAPAFEVHSQRLELLAYVTGAHAEDQPASGEVVESGVLLGRQERVAQADHRDMAEQPDPFGDGGQVGERGDGVVPDRAHRGREAARYGHVVAGGDVREPGPVGGARDLRQVLRSGVRLPGLGVEGALRLDRQLHPVGEPGAGPVRPPFPGGAHLALPGPAHSPSFVRPSSSIAFRRTMRSTTSGSRWPICASPTCRDSGQVESEWG